MADILDELIQVTKALDEKGIEYAVCGGLALSIHGFSRATFDIDILIREESLQKSFDVVKEYGYDIHGLDISFKERAVEIRRVSRINEENEILSLDFLLVTPFVEDVWNDRINVQMKDDLISIVSLDGLVKMKTLAGRHKDLIDIDRIQNEES
ncbi:MAG: hypothetical protein WKF92_03685 [Pyrinomonadaceae bacterium]